MTGGSTGLNFTGTFMFSSLRRHAQEKLSAKFALRILLECV